MRTLVGRPHLGSEPVGARARIRLTLIVTLLALSASVPAAAQTEAQDQAARLGWFHGRSSLMLDQGRKTPPAELVEALDAEGPALLLEGIYDFADMDAQQRAQRLAEARRVGADAPARRALQGLAAHAASPPLRRAAAASALHALRNPLAPTALTTALPGQQDPRLRLLLTAALLDAIAHADRAKGLSPIDRQLLTICRRVAALLACEDNPAWATAERLAEQIQRLTAEGRTADAGELTRRASLPTACADRFLAGLAAVSTETTPDAVSRELLRRVELFLGARVVGGRQSLEASTVSAMEALLLRTLRRAKEPRALAHAVGIAVLLDARALRPEIEPIVGRADNPELAAMARRALSRLGRAAQEGP